MCLTFLTELIRLDFFQFTKLIQSRNLYMPILAHFLHNGIAVLTVYMYPNMIEDPSELEIQMTLVIFSFLISGALFYSYYSLNRYILNRR